MECPCATQLLEEQRLELCLAINALQKGAGRAAQSQDGLHLGFRARFYGSAGISGPRRSPWTELRLDKESDSGMDRDVDI